MNKDLRLKVTAALDDELKKNHPEFARTKSASAFLWPGESLWKKDENCCSYFIVMSPDPKGRDEINVELAWSCANRFPEVTRRPSLVTAEAIANAVKAREGSVRLGSLCDGEFDWIGVREETILQVVKFISGKLQQRGLPFLAGLK